MSGQTAYRQFFTQQMGGEIVSDIRDALNTGLVLGNDRFKEQIQELTSIRQLHLKRRPRKEEMSIS